MKEKATPPPAPLEAPPHAKSLAKFGKMQLVGGVLGLLLLAPVLFLLQGLPPLLEARGVRLEWTYLGLTAAGGALWFVSRYTGKVGPWLAVPGYILGAFGAFLLAITAGARWGTTGLFVALGFCLAFMLVGGTIMDRRRKMKALALPPEQREQAHLPKEGIATSWAGREVRWNVATDQVGTSTLVRVALRGVSPHFHLVLERRRKGQDVAMPLGLNGARADSNDLEATRRFLSRPVLEVLRPMATIGGPLVLARSGILEIRVPGLLGGPERKAAAEALTVKLVDAAESTFPPDTAGQVARVGKRPLAMASAIGALPILFGGLAFWMLVLWLSFVGVHRPLTTADGISAMVGLFFGALTGFSLAAYLVAHHSSWRYVFPNARAGHPERTRRTTGVLALIGGLALLGAAALRLWG